MNDSDPGATLHFPPGTNGSAAPGVPDQSKAPPGMMVIKTDHGNFYARIIEIAAIVPATAAASPQHTPQVIPGKSTIVFRRTGQIQMVNHSPETVACVFARVLERDGMMPANHHKTD